MNEKFRNLPLRSGVGIVLLNKDNKIFVAKRIDNPENFWQMPQGGVEKVEIIEELDGFITYYLPNRLLGIIWKGKYKGQKQKWFLMRYLGEDGEINIKTKKPEFLDWKWVDLDEITKIVVKFKLHVYQEIQKKVQKILINRS